MAGNPFYQAQQNVAADPSQGQVPGGPGVAMPPGGAPYPNPEVGMQPTGPAGFDQVAQIRDSILAQFPDLMGPDEPPQDLSLSQKLGLFGLYMANPQGALDMIRERRDRQARREELRARMTMSALEAASSILKGQYETNKTILDMHTLANEDWRKNKAADLDEHVKRTELSLKQAQEARAARKAADDQAFRGHLMDLAFGKGGTVSDMPAEETMGGASGGPTPFAGPLTNEALAGDYARATNPPSTTEAPSASPGSSRFKKSISFGTGGSATLNLSEPDTTAKPRDPRVDFDGWLRGFISRYPAGILPSHLRPSTPDGFKNLVRLWQAERSQLAPGSFGAAGGGPLSGMPGPVRLGNEPGYEDVQGDEIEQLGR